jgi:hypothetical protein
VRGNSGVKCTMRTLILHDYHLLPEHGFTFISLDDYKIDSSLRNSRE